MYRLSYYRIGNKLHIKYFQTLEAATQFSIYCVNTGDVYDLVKVKNA